MPQTNKKKKKHQYLHPIKPQNLIKTFEWWFIIDYIKFCPHGIVNWLLLLSLRSHNSWEPCSYELVQFVEWKQHHGTYSAMLFLNFLRKQKYLPRGKLLGMLLQNEILHTFLWLTTATSFFSWHSKDGSTDTGGNFNKYWKLLARLMCM